MLMLTRHEWVSLCAIKDRATKIYGGVEVYFHAFLISALRGDEWSF